MDMKPPKVADFSFFPVTQNASASHHVAASFSGHIHRFIRSKFMIVAIVAVGLLGAGGYVAVKHLMVPKTNLVAQVSPSQPSDTKAGNTAQSSTPTKPKTTQSTTTTPSKSSSTTVPTTSTNSGTTSGSTTGTGSTSSGTSGNTVSGNCFPTPSSCGFPDGSNTGPVAGTAFIKVPEQATSGNGWSWDSRGWVSVSGSNVTVNGIQTSAGIDVTGSNVTIQNCIVSQNNGDFGISLRHTTNVTVKNCRISGTNASSGRLMVAIKSIYGDDVNPRSLANNIWYVSTGIQYCQGVIQDNYIHDLGYQSGDHLNGTTSNSGCNQLTIQHNTIFNNFDQTDAVSLFEDFGAQYNALITNNYVAGGGYTIYGGANAGGVVPKNVQIMNNRISDHYFPNGGYWGWLAAWNGSGSGNVCSGNVLEHTATGKIDPLGC